jgi:hypothetical protein
MDWGLIRFNLVVLVLSGVVLAGGKGEAWEGTARDVDTAGWL